LLSEEDAAVGVDTSRGVPQQPFPAPDLASDQIYSPQDDGVPDASSYADYINLVPRTSRGLKSYTHVVRRQ
jgi:hypothetical protein